MVVNFAEEEEEDAMDSDDDLLLLLLIGGARAWISLIIINIVQIAYDSTGPSDLKIRACYQNCY